MNKNVNLGICLRLILLKSCLFFCCFKEGKVGIHNFHNVTPVKIPSQHRTNGDSSFVKIDSIRINRHALYYRLIFRYRGKDFIVYKVLNEEYSLEFQKYYEYKPMDLVCYEVSDLPTGLIWDVIYRRSTHSFYLTEPYDNQAIGDTIDRKSFNFTKNYAIAIDNISKKRYKVKIKEIWPKFIKTKPEWNNYQ